MQWNEIRNRFKKSVADIQKKPVSSTDSKSSTKQQSMSYVPFKPGTIITLLVLLLIMIVLVIIMYSQKVTNFGPERDAGITREEARAAQEFLQQIPIQPLTQEEMHFVTSTKEPVESTSLAPEPQSPKSKK